MVIVSLLGAKVREVGVFTNAKKKLVSNGNRLDAYGRTHGLFEKKLSGISCIVFLPMNKILKILRIANAKSDR